MARAADGGTLRRVWRHRQARSVRRAALSGVAVTSAAAAAVLVLGLRFDSRSLWGFVAWWTSATGDVVEGRAAGRRTLAAGVLSSLFAGAGAAEAATTAEEDEAAWAQEQASWAKEDQDDCKCCSSDWCGCSGCTNCYAFLKANGYDLPLDARSAYAKAGVQWASALGWSAAFPKLPGAATVTAAEDFKVEASTLPDEKRGLLTKAALPRGAVLPPYQGRVLTFAEGSNAGKQVWCPVSAGLKYVFSPDDAASGALSKEPSFCIDSSETTKGNPARFVNEVYSVDQCKEVNLEICELGEVMYYRTTRDVPAGGELVTDSGDVSC